MTKPEQNNLNLTEVYEYRPSLVFDEFEGHIRIIKEQNHWSQKFLRKLKVRIPEKSYKKLDDYGTFIFKNIDGKKTVQELGELLSEAHEEASEELYERLVMYLEHLDQNEKWIQKISKASKS